MTESLTPSFLIVTDDVLSKTGTRRLLADIQITPRPAAPDPHGIAARNQWPDPPGPDATFEDFQRYAFVRASADYFLAFDAAAPLPVGFELSPAEAWALAEETYERMAGE
jgi:hypothetical protein